MNKLYCEKYDSYYDKDADVWLEDKCASKTCSFCLNRPDKPSDVKSINNNEELNK